MVPIDPKNSDRPVLIVEDDPTLRKVIVHSIENIGIPVLATQERETAFELVKRQPPSLVIASLEEGINNVDQYKQLAQGDNTDLVLILSDRLEDEIRTQLQPIEVIYKPFDTRYLCRRILTLLS